LAARWMLNILRITITAIGLAIVMLSAIGCGKRDVVVEIGGESFVMELAADELSRVAGMSYRDRFPDGAGMLFVFPEPQILQFWMYECRIDIDVIFLDAHGTVTAAHRMPAEPPRGEDESQEEYEARLPLYSSRYPAQFAIELPAGSIDRLSVQVDQRIDLPLDRLKQMAE